MTITEYGQCWGCGHNVLDFPALKCPWCSTRAPNMVLRDLHFEPGMDAVAMLQEVKVAMEAVRIRMDGLVTVRRAVCRALLAEGNVREAAELAGCKVASIEKWAGGRAPLSCANGHDRAEHGEYDGKRWSCRKCAEEPPAGPKARTPREIERIRRRDAWVAHRARLARREELARQGNLPERLRPPLPPPGGRRSSSPPSPD